MLDRYDQDLLLDYLEGDLDEAQRAQLDTALQNDPELAALLEAMSGDRDLLRSLPREQVPAQLGQDLTQVLERRMLMDESLGEAGPIPIARGRAMPTEPASNRGLRRVAALSALAASVGIAAGLVVFFMPPDPLQNTANTIAERSGASADKLATTDTFDAETATAGVSRQRSGSPAIAATDDTPSILEELSTPPDASTHTPGELASDIRAAEPVIPAADHLPETTDHIARAEEESGMTPSALGLAEKEPALRRDEFAWRGAERQAVGIANLQPEQQLVLFTEQPALSKQQLIHHCVVNGIPIVKGDENLNQLNAPQDATRQDAPPTVEAIDASDNYALLINDRQLNELLYSFNNDVLIDEPEPGRRAAITSQAAVVQPIQEQTPDRLAEQNPAEDLKRLPGFDLNHALSNTIPYEAPQAQRGRDINLYLPEDLGSSFANTRNRDNFALEQRRNTFNDRAARVRLNVQPTPDNDADATPRTPGVPGTPGGFEMDAQPQPEKADGTGKNGRIVADKTEAEPAALEDKLAETEPASTPSTAPRLDPNRSNWLAPHLPLSETTLILSWRNDTPSEPAQLVPIQIMTTPAEAVRSLRMLQQIQTRESADEAAPANEAESEEAGDVETEADEPTTPTPENTTDTDIEAQPAPTPVPEPADESESKPEPMTESAAEVTETEDAPVPEKAAEDTR